MICKKILKFALSYSNWSGSTDALIQSIRNESTEYLKTNGVYVFEHLIDKVEEDKWSNVRKLIKNVDMRHINKWELWEKLAEHINRKVKTPSLFSYDHDNFMAMLEVLLRVNYEPDPITDHNIFESAGKRIAAAENKLEKVLQFQSTLMCHKTQLFQPYKPLIEEHISSVVSTQRKVSQAVIKYIISQGIKADFWSPEFNAQLIKFCKMGYIDGKVRDHIIFSDLSTPNTEEQDRPSNYRVSATQQKIGQFLADLQYKFKPNVLINGMEVDFLFDNKTIVQYNGLHHYRINSAQQWPIPTRHDKWKMQTLQKRGYSIISIPFFEWQTYPNQKDQRKYLISKIQQSILQRYLGKQVVEQVRRKINQEEQQVINKKEAEMARRKRHPNPKTKTK